MAEHPLKIYEELDPKLLNLVNDTRNLALTDGALPRKIKLLIAMVLDAVAGHPRICKHIHLPLQAGSDRILERMNRTYSRKEFLTLVDEIRRRHAGIALTTDVICGFPTETEEDFLETCRTVEEVGFHAAYVFKYSERKHTIAERKYPDDVPEAVKADRVTRLVLRQKAISLQKNESRIGTDVEVLVEGDAKKSAAQWMGKSDDNITVVWEKEGPALEPGDLATIRVTHASATTLFGRPPAPPAP